jgi:predicted nucleic acid-binding protein
MIILDTNILSELMRPSPATAVVGWIAAQPLPSLFTTTITQAEILYGLALLPLGRRRTSLMTATVQIFDEDFSGRLLAFDSAAAQAFATITAARRQLGRPISSFDAQIAAIALSRRATVATRNTRDFAECGLTLINPWNA